ncbi:MAG: hypothetical protein QM698_06690 [Micropepsaceae bacterium]
MNPELVTRTAALTQPTERTPRRIGVPVFSYAGFDHFERDLRARGFYTVNLGDNVQSIALRRLLTAFGIAADTLIDIDRDTLRDYDGPPVRLVMNARFMPFSFPLPPQIEPIFIGFSADETTIAAAENDLRAHQPIGCRDPATCALLLQRGIAAYVAGCVTFTLPPRDDDGAARLYIAYGAGAGDLPPGLLKHVPAELLDTAVFVSQRLAAGVYPLGVAERRHMENVATGLLDVYRREARWLLTPLHHAASPCMAMGIPVTLARIDHNSRFGLLAGLTRLYQPHEFSNAMFPPQRADVEAIRAAYTADLCHRLGL